MNKVHGIAALLVLLAGRPDLGAADAQLGRWAACLPGALRVSRAVQKIADPFAPAGSEPRQERAGEDADLPMEAVEELSRLRREMKGLLVEPSPVLLLGNRIYRPGDRIEPRAQEGRGKPGLRLLLQRVTAEGAELAVWCERSDGPVVQRDILLRSPSQPGRYRREDAP